MKTTALILLAFALVSCNGKGSDSNGGGESDADTDADTDTDTDTDADFTFLTDDPSSYARVDRMGMPAVATAVITSDDAYNAADPVDDAAGDFVSEITTNVDGLHAALDDDITGAGLHPCTTADCVTQAAPLVVPDEIAIDTSGVAGFPNGRMLPDQVIDVTLAVILLDLTKDSVTVLAGIPLNPPANDVGFGSAFPYLAAAH